MFFIFSAIIIINRCPYLVIPTGSFKSWNKFSFIRFIQLYLICDFNERVPCSTHSIETIFKHINTNRIYLDKGSPKDIFLLSQCRVNWYRWSPLSLSLWGSRLNLTTLLFHPASYQVALSGPSRAWRDAALARHQMKLLKYWSRGADAFTSPRADDSGLRLRRLHVDTTR